MRKLVNAAYERARGILMNNRDELDALASELLDKESLTGAQVRSPCRLSVDTWTQARQPRQQLEFLGTQRLRARGSGDPRLFCSVPLALYRISAHAESPVL